MILTVSEIVSSVQGEGRYAGYPTTFIRMYGCNLRCRFCDSTYANVGRRKKMSVETVLNYVFKMGNQHVCITGGEPLLQESIYCLVYDLVERGMHVSIETNGSVEIEDTLYKRSYNYCMDIKCPSSGMSTNNCYKNLGILQNGDEVKFVISDVVDYLFAKDIIKRYPTKAQLIFSPCFDVDKKSNAHQLSQWVHEDKIPNSRLGVQLHKLIGFY